MAASPSLFWDDAQAFSRFAAAPPFARAARLLMTDGTLEGPEMSGFVAAFAERFSSRENLELAWRRYDTGHLGSVEPSFRDGLRFSMEQAR